jgi:ParG
MTEPSPENPSPQDTPRDAPAAGDARRDGPPADIPRDDPPAAQRGPSAFSSMDSARLLVRALATLPDEERDQVYTWLLGTNLPDEASRSSQLRRRVAWAVHAEAPPAQRQQFTDIGAEMVRTLVRGPGGSAQQMVPVRFSSQQHARLRAWCAEHGFSMATVIRGLVDRFLDSQQPGSS